MLSIYRLKPGFQSLLGPTAHRLHQAGISANQITAFTCIASVALGVWLATHSERVACFLLLPVWCFLRMALNAIDGIMAREFRECSTLGAYLNELGDVISDAALYLPFALVAGSDAALLALVVLLAWLTELAGVLGVMVSGERRHDGPMGKSDRAMAFGVLGLVIGLGVSVERWFTVAMAGIAILLVLTIVNRVRSGMHAASASRQASAE